VNAGFGYGNARLRARRSQFLTEATYYDLLAQPNIEQLITALIKTPYKNDIEAALVRVEGVAGVFEALHANLTRTLNQVRDFFTGPALNLVDILLRHWDRYNLLTILRGQSHEVSPETILAALVPVGQLDQVSLRELARQPGLRACLDLMITWRLPYAKTLSQVRARTGTVPDLDQLELALNRFHYSSLLTELGQGNKNQTLLLEHLRLEIDLINLITAFRLARTPEIRHLVQQRYQAADICPLLIEPGGRVSAKWLAEQVAGVSGVEELVNSLSETSYGPALRVGWQRYQAGQGGMPALERELERWRANRTAAMFTRNPLSIAIPIGYFGCKALEITNLRLLTQAVSLGLDSEQVRRDLIIIKEIA